jgi:hypothetical protein
MGEVSLKAKDGMGKNQPKSPWGQGLWRKAKSEAQKLTSGSLVGCPSAMA